MPLSKRLRKITKASDATTKGLNPLTRPAIAVARSPLKIGNQPIGVFPDDVGFANMPERCKPHFIIQQKQLGSQLVSLELRGERISMDCRHEIVRILVTELSPRKNAIRLSVALSSMQLTPKRIYACLNDFVRTFELGEASRHALA
jgi:hypothetical protein